MPEISRVLNILAKEQGKTMLARISKKHSAFQTLISTILSARARDEVTEFISKNLLKKYPNAKSLANAKLQDVKEIIKPIGFYNNKAKNIIKTSSKEPGHKWNPLIHLKSAVKNMMRSWNGPCSTKNMMIGPGEFFNIILYSSPHGGTDTIPPQPAPPARQSEPQHAAHQHPLQAGQACRICPGLTLPRL